MFNRSLLIFSMVVTTAFISRCDSATLANPPVASFYVHPHPAQPIDNNGHENLAEVPEPSTFVLVGSGALVLGIAAIRRKISR